MSFNIDLWKTKKLENLTLPLKAFSPESDVEKETDPQTGDFLLLRDGDMLLRGTLSQGTIHVQEIECCGETSGNFFEDHLLPALQCSYGTLEAALVWEGGELIERIRVHNGIVSREEVEL